MPNLGQIRRFLEPCDLEIWRMTLKNNRAPLLCYFKRCVSFRSHWWIQTWVTVRKHPIWVKFDNFFSHVTLKFDRWPWKTIGHLSQATSSFVHHFISICEFKLELQSGNGLGLNGVITSVTLTFDLWPWPFAWTSRRSMVITPENFRMVRWWEHSEKGVTDGRTDGQTDRKKCSKKEINTKITLEWVHEQFVTRVHALFYFLHDITNP